jgi:hypothetical protein
LPAGSTNQYLPVVEEEKVCYEKEEDSCVNGILVKCSILDEGALTRDQ